jgi:hypothetical protein
MVEVVTELTVDARGTEAGTAVYIRAMRAAQSAVDKVVEANQRAQEAMGAQGPVMAVAGQSIGRVAAAWERLRASIDPAVGEMKRIEQAILTSDAAFKRGITTQQQADQVLTQVIDRVTGTSAAIIQLANSSDALRSKLDPVFASAQRFGQELQELGELKSRGIQISGGYEAALSRIAAKYDETAVAAQRAKEAEQAMIQEARAAHGTDVFQRTINQQLGVTALPATQGGATFAALEEQMRQQEMIAQARAAQQAQTSQQNINQQFGIGRSAIQGGATVSALDEQAKFAAMADELRAKIDPLGEAQRRYNQEVEVYNNLLSRSLISTDEWSQANTMAAGRLQGITQAMGGAAKGAELTAFQLQLMQFQMQDVVMSLSTGQSPFQVMMQQGSQLVQMFRQGTGVREFLAATGRGIVTFLTNPLNIALLAFSSLVGVATLFFRNMDFKTKNINDVLKETNSILSQMRERFGDVVREAQKLPGEPTSTFRFIGGRSEEELRQIQNRETQETLRQVGGGITRPVPFQPGVRFADPRGEFAIFGDAIKNLQQSILHGEPDLIKFRKTISEIAMTDPFNKKIQDAAEKILKMTENGRDAQQALEGMRKTLEKITPREFDERVESTLRARRGMLSVEMGRLATEQQISLAGISARSPQELADIARRNVLAERGGDAATRDARAEIATKQALEEATYRLAQADRARLVASQESVQSQALETIEIGKTAGQVAQLTADYQLWIDLRHQAEQNHTKMDVDQFNRLSKYNEELGKSIDQTAKLNLQHDLQFEQAQIFRTPLEASIQERLRPIYGDDAVAAANSFAAAQMRINERLKEFRDLTADVTKGFLTDLRSGIGLAKSFENALTKVADNLTNKITEDISNSIASGLSQSLQGSLTGSQGIGGWLGDLVGGAFGAKKPLPGTPASVLDDKPFFKVPLPVTITGNIPDFSTRPSIGSLPSDIIRGSNLSPPVSTYGIQPGLSAPFISRTPFNMVRPSLSGVAGAGPVRVGAAGPTAIYPYADIIRSAAAQYNLDPNVLAGLIKQESGFQPWKTAPFPSHAAGLTQLQPGTARSLGVADPYDPRQSIYGGASYLSQQINRFGDVRSGLGAYYAGPGNFARRGFGYDPGAGPSAGQYANSIMSQAERYAQTAKTSLENMAPALSKVSTAASQATPSLGGFGQQITSFVSQLGGSTGTAGGGGGGFFSDPFGSIFGGGGLRGGVGTRASGGPIEAGHPYLVGEKRPELIVPRQSGNVIPFVPRDQGISVQVHNYSRADVSTKEDTDSQGNRRLIFVVDDQIADIMRRPGTRTNRALAKRGAAQPLVGRS